MTPTQIARRSDSLYWANVPRRELCDMIAHREADLKTEREARKYWQKIAEELMKGKDDE